MSKERRTSVTSDDLEMPRIATDKKVGLALGGGGARGLAHLGVLAVLLQEGIPIDAIAGTSMGAVIGAAHATGYDVHDLIRMALQFRWRNLIDLNWNGRGFLKGERLEALVDDLSGGKNFDETRIPFAIVTADLNTGEEVVMKEGPIARAARASCAFPGVFTPVEIGGRWLFDGGVVNQVPADVAVSLGADVVIAVDTSGSPQRHVMGEAAPAPGLMSQLTAMAFNDNRYPVMKDLLEKVIDIFIDQITTYRLRIDRPIIVIRPAVGQIKLEDFRRAEECIAAGITAAEAQLPAIRALLTGQAPEQPGEIVAPAPDIVRDPEDGEQGWIEQLRTIYPLASGE